MSIIVFQTGKEQTAFRRVKHIEQDIQMVHQMVDHGLLKDRHIEDDGTSYMDGAKTGVPVNATDSENTSTSTEQRTAGASDTVYVELGAGKGLLGLAVNCADPEATLVLVERGVNRNKVNCLLFSVRIERLFMFIFHSLLNSFGLLRSFIIFNPFPGGSLPQGTQQILPPSARGHPSLQSEEGARRGHSCCH
jgi:hypothetical protein